MNIYDYKYIISCSDADALHELEAEIGADHNLAETDKATLADLIQKRFACLNAVEVGPQKGRW